MKSNTWITLPVAWILAVLLAVGAMGVMTSAFALDADINSLWGLWAVAGLVGGLCHSLKSRWSVLILLAGIAGYLVLLWEPVVTALNALLVQLTTTYDAAYGWGIWEADLPRFPDLEPILGLWGCLIAIATTNTIIRGRWISLPILLALIPVGSTVVVLDTPADTTSLFLVMLVLLLLILTSTVRRQNVANGGVLILLLGLPLSLLLGGLFWLNPQDTYVNHAQEYLDAVTDWWNGLPARHTDTTGLLDAPPAGSSFSATTNLARVGPRSKWGLKVMEVKTNYTDTVYLRGQVYDIYDGISWDAEKDRQESFGLPGYVFQGTNYKSIEIRTNSVEPYQYLPYYTAIQHLQGGRLNNTDHAQHYTFAVADLPPNAYGTATFLDDHYLELPAETRQWAEAYFQDILLESGLNSNVKLTNAAKVALILNHVQNSAAYSIKTPQMPKDQTDFARWFLEESDTGYCVHFATATAVLLRGAGVPARYVTGYAFPAKANQVTTVTSDHAHAWVEYYNEYLGEWLVVESTPPDFSQEEQDTKPTEPTDPPTKPPVEITEPVTEPVTESSTDSKTETRPGNKPVPSEQTPRPLSPLLWLLGIPGLWLVVEIQYRIRRRRNRADTPNGQALVHWQQIQEICRLTQQVPPEELEALAQKAKFSQHTLTPAELDGFTAWIRTQRPRLSLRHRFLCRYLLALW